MLENFALGYCAENSFYVWMDIPEGGSESKLQLSRIRSWRLYKCTRYVVCS
jgi:hypothetical protein